MGWHLCAPPPTVHVDYLAAVDGEPAVRVHRNAEQTRVGLSEGGRKRGREGGREGGRDGGRKGE